MSVYHKLSTEHFARYTEGDTESWSMEPAVGEGASVIKIDLPSDPDLLDQGRSECPIEKTSV